MPESNINYEFEKNTLVNVIHTYEGKFMASENQEIV
jgi:hypothetical protein